MLQETWKTKESQKEIAKEEEQDMPLMAKKKSQSLNTENYEQLL